MNQDHPHMLSPPSTPISMSVGNDASNNLRAKPGERVLYWGSGSPQAWRVLIALELKQIEYRGVCVSFSSGLLKTDFFRQLNPRMRIPIFVDTLTGAVVYESLAILEYLERCYPAIPLLPSPQMHVMYAMAQTRLQEANEILSTVGELIVYLRRVPKERQNPQVLQAKWEALETELSLWEGYLNGNSYLLGSSFYLCDIALFTNLAYAVRCGLKLDGIYPNLAKFYSSLCSWATVDKTWPPHWKLSCGQPVLSRCYENRMN